MRAAREVIIERGYQAASFQAIAAHIGISRPTLHYYFSSREELYTRVAGEVAVTLEAICGRAHGAETLVAQLADLLRGICELNAADPLAVKFVVTARLDEQRVPGMPEVGARTIQSFLEDILRDAIRRGELPEDTDVAEIAELLHAVLWGLGLWAGDGDDCVDMRSVTALLVNMLAGGLVDGASQRPSVGLCAAG